MSKGFIMKKLCVNSPANQEEIDNLNIFIDWATSCFSDSTKVVWDVKDVDAIIRNCVIWRGILEKNLKEAKGSSEKNRILDALDRNRLNYSYFVMLKKKGRSQGRHN